MSKRSNEAGSGSGARARLALLARSDVAVLDHADDGEAGRDGDEEDPAEDVEPLPRERRVRLLAGDHEEHQRQPEPDHAVGNQCGARELGARLGHEATLAPTPERVYEVSIPPVSPNCHACSELGEVG